MAINFGSIPLSSLYMGTTAINHVYLGTTSVFASGGGGSLKPNTLNNPPLGVRLGVLSNNGHRPFINQFKMCNGGWQEDGGSYGGMSYLIGLGYVNMGGSVISLPPNGLICRPLDGIKPTDTAAAGRWRFRWQGGTDVILKWGDNIDKTGTHEFLFDYTPTGDRSVAVVVNSLTGGVPHSFSMVHEDDWEDDDAGRIFRKAYLDEVRNYRCLRFDEWTGILRGEPEGLMVKTWADRPVPSDELFHRFVPYEWQVALCNEIGADGWFCLPTACDDNHMSNAATLISNTMNTKSHVYVEYSTKTWDFSGTAQAHYCAEQGREAFGTTGSPTYQEYLNWYGMRTCQMAQIWRSVWGANPRLHIVVQNQCDWTGNEESILTAPMWRDRDGTLGLPPYVAPHTVIDMLTVHAQVDGGMAYGARSSEITAWRTGLSQTQAFNNMRDQMLDGRFFDTSDVGQRNVIRLTSKWNYYRGVANTYGLELGCYELGNHLNGVGGGGDNAAFIADYSASSQMGEVYTAAYNALVAAGFDGPICFSVECRIPDYNTSMGLQRFLGDHSPAWQAMNTINMLNNGPNNRGATDFIGPYDAAV